MKYKTLILSVIASSLFAQPVPQDVIDTGDKVTNELLHNLGSKLQHEIQTNGLLAAAKFCNSNALILTEEVNLRQVEGVSVKRISLKERSPANIPSQDEAETLSSMQTLHDEKKLPAYIIKEDLKAYKYYKPLVIKQDACLKCHGDLTTNPGLSAYFKENYPQDKATGYKMGDLRGAILVEIKK